VIEENLPEIVREHAPAALGVGFGGPVDWRRGRVVRSFQINGWDGFEIERWLHSLSGLPVSVDNDANVGALGEARHGAGQGLDPVFYVTLGSGVGAGLVVDGRIYHGAAPGEAEFGHLRLDRDGTELESRCSGWSVDARIRHAAALDGASAIARLARQSTGQRGEARIILEALREGDSETQRILGSLGRDLGFGLSHVVHLLNPEVIIIGGGLSLIGEPLRAAVAGELAGFLMPGVSPGPKVRLAALAEVAIPVGAIELARNGDRMAHTPER
jgi:glucokinase